MSLPPNAAIQSFWATHFYAFQWRHHPSHAPAIISHLYELRDRQRSNIASGIAPGAKSPQGLYESDFDLLVDQHAGLQALRSFIAESISVVVSHVNGGQLQPQELCVEICESWFHITNDHGFHDAHFHCQCSWCGIYYLQIGDSGRRSQQGAPNGSNRFYSPLWRGGTYGDYGNAYLGQTYLDPPISDGMLLVFPAHLMHSGLPYDGDKDRIVISVNTRTVPTAGS